MPVRAVDDKPSDTLVVVSEEGFWTGSSTLPHLHQSSSCCAPAPVTDRRDPAHATLPSTLMASCYPRPNPFGDRGRTACPVARASPASRSWQPSWHRSPARWRRSAPRRRTGQVDRHGLHVRRQQPRGLHRQGPRARAGGPRLQAERPDHSTRRPRSWLRQEPRRLADHEALPPDAGDDRRRRAAPSPTGASATWATRTRSRTSSSGPRRTTPPTTTPCTSGATAGAGIPTGRWKTRRRAPATA